MHSLYTKGRGAHFMNLSELALPPDGTALQMAVLTTFDLDLSFLSALPLDPESAKRFLVFYGDGRFHDCRENDARRNLTYDMLVPVVFPPGKNGWPRAHAHGKIWLFVFSSPIQSFTPSANSKSWIFSS